MWYIIYVYFTLQLKWNIVYLTNRIKYNDFVKIIVYDDFCYFQPKY